MSIWVGILMVYTVCLFVGRKAPFVSKISALSLSGVAGRALISIVFVLTMPVTSDIKSFLSTGLENFRRAMVPILKGKNPTVKGALAMMKYPSSSIARASVGMMLKTVLPTMSSTMVALTMAW